MGTPIQSSPSGAAPAQQPGASDADAVRQAYDSIQPSPGTNGDTLAIVRDMISDGVSSDSRARARALVDAFHETHFLPRDLPDLRDRLESPGAYNPHVKTKPIDEAVTARVAIMQLKPQLEALAKNGVDLNNAYVNVMSNRATGHYNGAVIMADDKAFTALKGAPQPYHGRIQVDRMVDDFSRAAAQDSWTQVGLHIIKGDTASERFGAKHQMPAKAVKLGGDTYQIVAVW